MAVVLPQQGELSFLADIRNSPDAYALRLFQNSVTLGPLTVLTSLTEANFSGYAAATPTWTLPVIDGSGRAAMTASSMTFSHNGGGTSNTIFGYYFVHVTSGKLLFCESFATPKTMSVFGDSITITPTMTLAQG